MFNDGFFPTPGPVIVEMIHPLRQRDGKYDPDALLGRNILDPSAGKGNILDYLTVQGRIADKARVMACEIEPELQSILTGKGYPVVASNFLEYDDHYAFDLILMNPPFVDGVKHLLKAWSIVVEGGDVVCLLNAESIDNPYTGERKLLANIIEANGGVQRIGKAFQRAERPTDVEVVIVRLHKPERQGFKFDETLFEQEFVIGAQDFNASPLATANIVEALVSQYDAAVRLLREIDERRSQLAFYLKGTDNPQPGQTIAVLTCNPHGFNQQVALLKRRFWSYIFDRTALGKTLTSDFRKRFDEMLNRAATTAFTYENIMLVLETFFANRAQFMLDCIMKSFDDATSYHRDNVIHTEGWVTNKSWKIAPKIIIPRGIRYDKFGWMLQWSDQDFYNDLDRVMCFLSGAKYEDTLTIYKAMEQHIRPLGSSYGRTPADEHWNEWFDSAFFSIKIFKKGTVHLRFKDADLLARFNQAAAQGKGWLGDGVVAKKPQRRKAA